MCTSSDVTDGSHLIRTTVYWNIITCNLVYRLSSVMLDTIKRQMLYRTL